MSKSKKKQKEQRKAKQLKKDDAKAGGKQKWGK